MKLISQIINTFLNIEARIKAIEPEATIKALEPRKIIITLPTMENWENKIRIENDIKALCQEIDNQFFFTIKPTQNN